MITLSSDNNEILIHHVSGQTITLRANSLSSEEHLLKLNKDNNCLVLIPLSNILWIDIFNYQED